MCKGTQTSIEHSSKFDVGQGPPLVFPINVKATTEGGLLLNDNGLNAVVHVDQKTGNRTVLTSDIMEIGTGPKLLAPVSVALARTKDVIYVADEGLEAIVAVDMATGNRSILSSADKGKGNMFADLRDIIVDDATGDIIVTDMGVDAVWKIDHRTGDRTIISSSGSDVVGDGVPLGLPAGLKMIPGSRDILIVAVGSLALVRVEGSTGNRTLVSGNDKGMGFSFVNPRCLFVDPISQDILVSDLGRGCVFCVDPTTGDRTIVSGKGVGNGPMLQMPYGVGKLDNGNICIVDRGLEGVLEIDSRTGDRKFLSTGRASNDTGMSYPVSLVKDKVGGGCIVVDAGAGKFLRLERESSPTAIWERKELGKGRAIAALNSQSKYTAIDLDNKSIVLLDSKSGEYQVVSNSTVGKGPTLNNPRAIASSRDGHSILIGDANGSLVAVDPTSGDRTVISSKDRGHGIAMSIILGIEDCPEDNSIVVADTGAKALIKVDKKTGNRTLLSGAGRGTGPALGNPTGLVRLPSGHFVVSDDAAMAVLTIDPITGDRRELSGSNRGAGSTLICPFAISLSCDMGKLLVADAGRKLIIEVEIGTGDRSVFGQTPCKVC